MVEFSPDVKRRLDELRATFVAGLPDRVAAIVAATAPLTTALGADESRETVDQLRRLAHQLAGTAGTFGFDAPGDIAQGIEVACTPLLEGAAPPNAAQCDDLAQRVRALEAASAEAIEPYAGTAPAEGSASRRQTT